ncbi:MAG: adenylyltransferase/cytidyltransferase family protein [Nanoarchaeota archaeon]|nr:adenylyltransferase/cytidyltransferase family protein [Nanoarchaeota archaeon]
MDNQTEGSVLDGLLYINGIQHHWMDIFPWLHSKGLSSEDVIALFGGRFMPYHKGHFETHKKIADFYSHVHIGIVNPDPWDTKLEGERFTLDKNFLTYVERLEMIEGALEQIGNRSRTTISPYYPSHVYGEEKFWRFTPGNPQTVISHIAVRDDFDRKKKQRAIESGRTFVEMPLVYKSTLQDSIDGAPLEDMAYGATKIREYIVEGNDLWREMVPSFTADVIDRYNIVERLKDLTADALRQKD